ISTSLAERYLQDRFLVDRDTDANGDDQNTASPLPTKMALGGNAQPPKYSHRHLIIVLVPRVPTNFFRIVVK
ncbi:hypothetical protein COCMIDRAFT_88450, partial [Bipolaris oryzae ATCC 44560]